MIPTSRKCLHCGAVLLYNRTKCIVCKGIDLEEWNGTTREWQRVVLERGHGDVDPTPHAGDTRSDEHLPQVNRKDPKPACGVKRRTIARSKRKKPRGR